MSTSEFPTLYNSIKGNPIKGTYLRREGRELIIGATTKTWHSLFVVPFALIWSTGAIGGIYGSQILQREFDPGLSLFGLPFLLGVFLLCSKAVMSLVGKTEVRFTNKGGTVFTGVQKIGFTDTFTWSEISEIEEHFQLLALRSLGGSALVMKGKRKIIFGRLLSKKRRNFLLKNLQLALVKGKRDGQYV